jgi:hypothetical protein
MEDRVRRGIDIALMDDGPDRQAALADLKATRAQTIWSPPKKGARDRRLQVFRVDAFQRENEAISSPISPEEWVDARGHEGEAMPDPEEAAEQNVLTAEQAEADN